ncbi:hypothetical protein ABZY09_43575 [Streptomyces sp. NPDC002928]|uniref:hypothetical protein n=1 Tax=Streptomyces sp. NPDC002928 TaxID=3154440 RepID=UPI0033BAAE45
MSTRWGARKPKPDRLLVDDTLAILRDRYQGLSELVDARMEALAAALKPNASVTVQCGMCRQQALAVGQHQPHCHFCRVTWGSPTSRGSVPCQVFVGDNFYEQRRQHVLSGSGDVTS